MSCHSTHDCKSDEYCDVSTSICEPCQRICRPKNTDRCAQFCPHWAMASSTTTALISAPKTGCSNESLNFETVHMWVSSVVIIFLVVIIIIILVVKKTCQQIPSTGMENPAPRLAERKSHCEKWIYAIFRKGKFRTKLGADETQSNDDLSSSAAETSGKRAIKQAECRDECTGSDRPWSTLNGNLVSYPSDSCDTTADESRLLSPGPEDALLRQQQVADGETKRKSCSYNPLESYHNVAVSSNRLPTFVSWSPDDDTESTREFCVRSDVVPPAAARCPAPMDEKRTTSLGQFGRVLEAYRAVEHNTEELSFIRLCMVDGDALRIVVSDDYDVDECYRKIIGVLPADVPRHLVCVYRASEQI